MEKDRLYMKEYQRIKNLKMSITKYTTPTKLEMNPESRKEPVNSVKRSYEPKKRYKGKDINISCCLSVNRSLNLYDIFIQDKLMGIAEMIVNKDGEQTEQELQLQDMLKTSGGCNKRSREDDNGNHEIGTPVPRKQIRALHLMHVNQPMPVAHIAASPQWTYKEVPASMECEADSWEAA